MTSQTETLGTPYVAAPRYAWRRPVFAFALTLGAVVFFTAAFAFGYGRMNEGRALAGVDIAGIDLAGLSRSAAAAKLRATLPDLSAGELTVTIGGDTSTIPYADFDRDYDIDLMLDQAFGLGRGDNFISQIREQFAIALNGMSVPALVTWDNEKLAAQVAELALAAQVTPVDAGITRVDGEYVVTPGTDGFVVDTESVVTAAVSAINNLSAADAAITVEGTPVNAAIATAQAQAAADRVERVIGEGLALSGADLSTTIPADVLRGWVYLNESSAGAWSLSIASDPIAQYLATYAGQTDIPPTNATFGFEGGSVSVIPSAAGRALDVDASTANVMAALNARADGNSASSAELALTATQPEFDTAQAQTLASRVELLGTWTTKYTPQVSNGHGVNIQIPTRIIDGDVVQPGEQFDFLTAIGPVTSPPYQEGGILIHGQIKEDGAIGGGMCSVSTTLFNAAMRAGLQIDERDNHSIYISRYPVGLDATVWEIGGRRQTMAFTNDTDYPIMIKGINKRTSVTFEIYGINDGRSVDLRDANIGEITKGGAWLEYSDALAPGQRREKQDRYDSFTSNVSRVVRDAQGNVIHDDTWGSRYKKLDRITLVGRYPGDPPAGTKIKPEDYPGAPKPPTDPGTPGDPGDPGDPGEPGDPGTPFEASFSAAQQDGTLKVTFTGAPGKATSYSWNIAGNTFTGRSVEVTFNKAGKYNVTLTVVKNGIADSVSGKVTVAAAGNPDPPDPPDPDPTPTPTPTPTPDPTPAPT